MQPVRNHANTPSVHNTKPTLPSALREYFYHVLVTPAGGVDAYTGGAGGSVGFPDEGGGGGGAGIGVVDDAGPPMPCWMYEMRGLGLFGP